MKYLILIFVCFTRFLISGDGSGSAEFAGAGVGAGASAGMVGDVEQGFAGAHAHKRTGSSDLVIDFKAGLAPAGPQVAPAGSVVEQVEGLLGLSTAGKRGFAGSDQARFSSFGRGEPGDSIALLLARGIDKQNELASAREKAKKLRQAEKKQEREVAAKAQAVADRRACCLNVLNGFGVIAGVAISTASIIISAKPKEKQD